MYVINDIIHRYKAALGYSLLIKLGIWKKTKELICEIIYAQLTAIATKIKETNRSTNAVILVLEQYIESVAVYAFHSYA